MSGRSQSQRLAKQLRENETTAKNKFPTWDENARAYYSDLKDKDRGGRLTSGSLDHYLYHTYLHKMREERVQKLQTAAAGKPLKESTAAGKHKRQAPRQMEAKEATWNPATTLPDQRLNQRLKNPSKTVLAKIMQIIMQWPPMPPILRNAHKIPKRTTNVLRINTVSAFAARIQLAK